MGSFKGGGGGVISISNNSPKHVIEVPCNLCTLIMRPSKIGYDL